MRRNLFFGGLIVFLIVVVWIALVNAQAKFPLILLVWRIPEVSAAQLIVVTAVVTAAFTALLGSIELFARGLEVRRLRRQNQKLEARITELESDLDASSRELLGHRQETEEPPHS